MKSNFKKKLIFISIFLFIVLYLFSDFSPIVFINHTPYFAFTRELDLFYYDDMPYDNDDLNGIKRLKWLKTLKIQGNEITDVSFLYSMDEIENIIFWGNGDNVDFMPIKNCKKLASFYGGSFGLTNADVFKDCVNLKTLSIEMVESRLLLNHNTQLSDISSIKYLVNLVTLSVYGNNISDISSLNYCTNLSDITLHGINASDHSPLLNLPNLKKLTIDEDYLTKQEITALQQRGILVIERSINSDY